MYEFETRNELGVSKVKIALFSLIVITILAIYGVSISFTGKAALVRSGETGSSVAVSFSPDHPKVLEKMSIETTVTSDKKEDFFLELIIVQNGIINEYRNYTFSLDAGDSDKFVMYYTPSSVEKQNIVVDLYSSDKKVLYDTKTMEFKAESDIGPFDFEINTPTNFVQKGEKLPFTISMKNLGLKGVDVNLTVSLDCFNKSDIEQSSFIFINGSDELEKNFILPTCNEAGQHRIRASLSAYGTDFVSSKSQYFETDDLLHLDFFVPDVITAAENSSYTFNVKYGNNNKETVSNIKPIVSGIPSSWFTVTPLVIPEIKSGDISVAIITLNIPKNSEGDYQVLIGVSGDNLFSYAWTSLKITGTAEKGESAKTPKINFSVFTILFISSIIIGVLILGILYLSQLIKRAFFNKTNM